MKKMKKLIITLMAAALISATATAQKEDKCKCPEKKFDKTEMAKHRTDDMVKEYKLSDKQAKQLLELNTKYADKMRPPRHHGPKPGHGPKADEKGQRPEPPKANDKGQRPEPPKDGQRPERPKDGKHEAHHKQMQETMKAYEAELQKIMTPDQFKAYQSDMQNRHKHHPKAPEAKK